jgi:hypothetical protein
LLPVNGVGNNKIHNCRKNDQPYKITTGLIKKVQRKKAEDVTAYFKIVAEYIIEKNKNTKKENEEAIVEQQRIFRVVKKLVEKRTGIKSGHRGWFYFMVVKYLWYSFMRAV